MPPIAGVATRLVTTALLAQFACGGVAHAEPVATANVTAELLSEQETIRPGEPFTLGIALRPAPGWHTYWKNPGGSGLPTKVQWKLPEQLHASELEWPHPVPLGEPPFVAYGYEGNALLLSRVEAAPSLRAGTSLPISALVEWLACREDACVPGKAQIDLRLNVENAPPHRDSRWGEVFDSARAELPRSLPGWSATAKRDGETIRIEVIAAAGVRPSTTGIRVFPLDSGVLDPSAATTVHASDSGFVLEAAATTPARALPETIPLVLVAEGGWDETGEVRALQIDARRLGPPGGEDVAPKPAARLATTATTQAAFTPSTFAGAGDVTLVFALLLAFAGGLVLNLMPCVFPVLSLKILGFVSIAHHDSAKVRRHGYTFAAGVILSFWLLAGLLLALRAAGGAIGWGFQLQEPLFVAAIAALLLAMSLNFLGLFEFGGALSAAVSRHDSHSGYLGSFLSGVLATILATPCTAPFMGTALGFALTQPPAQSLAVFTALGAGMSSPYVVLACVPSLLTRLPKPGAWMVTLRRAMAIPLLATVIWLMWVFNRQTGDSAAMMLGAALTIGAIGAWLWGRASSTQSTATLTAWVCVGAAAVLMVTASSQPHTDHALTADEGAGALWRPWNPDAIDQLRREGNVVFVDFTADWCLSCKVNERVALSGEAFTTALAGHNVVAMKADWTRADPLITEALAAFGRSGVPLYVVYPKDLQGEVVVLPQVLTPGIIEDALARAAT